MRRSLITGATGQDGWYLTELLLSRGHHVIGTSRQPGSAAGCELRQAASTWTRANSRFQLEALDPVNAVQVDRIVQEFQPHEIYNLASQSHVGQSFVSPLETLQATAGGAIALLEAARRLPSGLGVRMYQASSSDMFGAAEEFPQNEGTLFRPRSPYACAKVCAFHLCVLYRESYGVFVSNGILFNHESPRRPVQYVTRKVTCAAARIAAGLDHELRLGTLDAGRDWGFARDYVDAMSRMLQHDRPDDFVIATNEWRRIDELLEAAFARVNLHWQDYVKVDPALSRPAEVSRLQGDFGKAERVLGWRPTTTFVELVNMMVDADVQRVHESQSQSGR